MDSVWFFILDSIRLNEMKVKALVQVILTQTTALPQLRVLKRWGTENWQQPRSAAEHFKDQLGKHW